MKISLSTAAFVAVVLCSHAAVAQQPAAKPAKQAPAAAPSTRVTSDYTEKQDADGSQVIDFGNDKLEGPGVDYYGGVIKPPPTVVRAGLIRPRMNFVPELLKSVENL
jgi:hypothetical protein